MISVIIPCKNIISESRKESFRKMMGTLDTQTYKDFELIIVDGASEDGTIELLQDYIKSGRINTLISEKDKGLYEAMNKGLKIARGEYVHVMNSDDYFSVNNFFERSLEALEKNKVDFTHADRIIEKRDGGSCSIKKGDERVAFFRMPFRYQTMLIKKSIYDEFGLMNEKFTIAGDYEFILKMVMAGKKGFYFSEVFIYSLDGGISSNKLKCIEEVSQVLFECYGRKYDLTIDDCENIYKKTISPELLKKIITNVKDDKIVASLKYCYDNEKIGEIQESPKLH